MNEAQWSLRPRIYVDQQGSQNCLSVFVCLIHLCIHAWCSFMQQEAKLQRICKEHKLANNLQTTEVFILKIRDFYSLFNDRTSWRGFVTSRKSLFREIASVTQLRRTDLGKMRQGEWVCWPFAVSSLFLFIMKLPRGGPLHDHPERPALPQSSYWLFCSFLRLERCKILNRNYQAEEPESTRRDQAITL